MISRKEEERNEKIIRGLMKLPPNRRCINCYSLGPQYVCTNFLTFVCTACSGIHREFTHRVKSVSMAKFTSQEVEALQRGGNQRARETFLKDWDLQRQRLPDSSNVDRIREFIKHVYVDRKYAGGKTPDKPPRDMQSLKNHQDDTRRASSYHSYSQSPPYEYQYEERKYGKQAGVLSRKPGSDRGNYEGKVSSFVYSPGRLGEQMYEDRFANEGSASRVSDFSVSSSGDAFKSDTQSPSFHSSPPTHPVRDILVEDARRQTSSAYSGANAKGDVGANVRTQRNASLGSFGSFDSNSVSLNSVNSGSLLDVFSEPERSAGTQSDRIAPVHSVPQSSASANAVGSDPFNTQQLQQLTASSAPSVDFFKKPQVSYSPSIDLFADINHQHLAATPLEPKPSTASFPNNDGWATFDLPQHEASIKQIKNVPPATTSQGDVSSSTNTSIQCPSTNYKSFDLPQYEASISQVKNAPAASTSRGDIDTSVNLNVQWPPASDTPHKLFLPVENQWHGSLHGVQPSSDTNSQSWNAFEDTLGSFSQASYESLPYMSEPQPMHPSLMVQKPPPTMHQHSSSKCSEGGMSSHAGKSTNPFDIQYDSAMDSGSAFLNMNSLQAALPDTQLPPAYVGDLTQPWFSPSTVTPYIPTAPQAGSSLGGLAYMAGEGPLPQLPNIPVQGPVAPLGGNPFA